MATFISIEIRKSDAKHQKEVEIQDRRYYARKDNMLELIETTGLADELEDKLAEVIMKIRKDTPRRGTSRKEV